MPAAPPILKAFQELVTDKRFDDADLEFTREDSPPEYRITVTASFSLRDDVAAFAALMAAVGEFADQHELDTQMIGGSVVWLTPRG